MKRALVVYESMYGNTQRIAQAIADGLSTHLKVGVVEVGTAPQHLPPDVGLLVVGGPTHAFGMSRPESRQSAAKRGPTPLVSQGPGVREWLNALVLEPSQLVAATFCTKVGKPRFFWGSAARRERRLLRYRGVPVVDAKSFFVGFKPPENALLEGEEARAQLWGDKLGEDFVAAHTGHLHDGLWAEPPMAAS
jgi:hypothetical protein